jgi:hypothetical protein
MNRGKMHGIFPLANRIFRLPALVLAEILAPGCEVSPLLNLELPKWPLLIRHHMVPPRRRRLSLASKTPGFGPSVPCALDARAVETMNLQGLPVLAIRMISLTASTDYTAGGT